MTTITEHDWKKIKKSSKKVQSSIPKDLELKIIRTVVQNPSSIEFLFSGYRRGIKDKLNDVKKLEVELSETTANDETKVTLQLMFLFAQRYLEMFEEISTVIEALAFQNIETRKDLYKLIRLSIPLKNKGNELTSLLTKLEKKEQANTKFSKDYEKNKSYVRLFKDFIDHEAGKTTRK